jgi:hypothetical protein
MLRERTVLVLGAGASNPYGYPTGIELSKLVFEQMQPLLLPVRALVDCGFQASEIYAFRDEFYYSGKNSIDAFLEHRIDLMKIGKAITAALLIGFENPWALFRYDVSGWLRYIYNRLNATIAEFKNTKLSIITFNYDRAVEHFFFTSLQNTYKITDEECAAALKAIPIIHLHGSLGDLPWQAANGRPYSSELSKQAIQARIDGIKIIHEDITDGRDLDFEYAKKLMQDADRIVFLGFGFNQTNAERLATFRRKNREPVPLD